MRSGARKGFAPALLTLALLVPAAARSQEALPPPGESPILAWFDFEGEAVETGPYTLIAYEDARGSVRLTTRYRLSGFRSVEIRDVAGDGDFAELQGNRLETVLTPINGDEDYVANVTFLFSEDGNSFCVAFNDTNRDAGELGSFRGERVQSDGGD